ncbi:MAG: hypothetical protein MI924_32035 [Chloroflexales bacterium]|nr:hypothetical protein [Chloroflexales bacterium]
MVPVATWAEEAFGVADLGAVRRHARLAPVGRPARAPRYLMPLTTPPGSRPPIAGVPMTLFSQRRCRPAKGIPPTPHAGGSVGLGRARPARSGGGSFGCAAAAGWGAPRPLCPASSAPPTPDQRAGQPERVAPPGGRDCPAAGVSPPLVRVGARAADGRCSVAGGAPAGRRPAWTGRPRSQSRPSGTGRVGGHGHRIRCRHGAASEWRSDWSASAGSRAETALAAGARVTTQPSGAETAARPHRLGGLGWRPRHAIGHGANGVAGASHRPEAPTPPRPARFWLGMRHIRAAQAGSTVGTVGAGLRIAQWQQPSAADDASCSSA